MAKDAINSESTTLKDAAMDLFGKARATGGRHFNAKNEAISAFRDAKVFLDVADAVELGEISAEPEQADVYETVEVPVWQQQSDEKWKPVLDPLTKKQVTMTVAVDRDAYAPNLDAGHPINLRCKPRDGVSVAERIEKFKAERESAMAALN